MCLMHTDLPGPRGADDHRDLVFGQAHVQPAQHVVAPERLVHVDELDRVGRLRRTGCAVWYWKSSCRRGAAAMGLRSLATRHPPIGARGLAPQKTCVPSIPMMCTSTMLSTIDLAVALPTPTGPPEAL